MNATFQTRTANLRANLARLQEKNGPEAGRDLDKILNDTNSPFFFSAAIDKQVNDWGIDASGIFSTTVNPKVTKRFVQFVGAIHHKQYLKVDRTTACILLGLHLAGDFPLTSEALYEIGTGGKVKNEGMGADRRGVSTRTVSRLVGAVSTRTIETQLCRSVGKNGFLQLAGATTGEPGKKNQVVTLNRAHPMVKAFINLIENATEGQIDEMVGDKK